MNVIGFSAGAAGREGNVDRMVKAVLDGSGHHTEFVKLSELDYSGCKGCVHLCARPQVCMLEDNLLPYYQKIKEADAVVVGAPVHFDSINGMAVSFIERFFGYRHVSIAISGKPFVGVVCGALTLEHATAQMTRVLKSHDVNLLDVVEFNSHVPPCLKCGRHKECRIGGLYKMLGDDALEYKITKESFLQWEDDAQAAAAVKRAAETLKGLGC